MQYTSQNGELKILIVRGDEQQAGDPVALQK